MAIHVVVEVLGECEGFENRNCVGAVYGPYDTKAEAWAVKEQIDPFFAPHVMTLSEYAEG